MSYEQALALTKTLQAAKPNGITVRMAPATAEGAYKVTLALMGEPIKTWATPVTADEAIEVMLASA